MRQFSYPMKLMPDKADGGYVVTCRDLPEAITQGETLDEALAEAADCLEEAIAARIDDGREIPASSAAKRGERVVSVPPSMAFKAAVYLAVREAGISKVSSSSDESQPPATPRHTAMNWARQLKRMRLVRIFTIVQ